MNLEVEENEEDATIQILDSPDPMVWPLVSVGKLFGDVNILCYECL